MSRQSSLKLHEAVVSGDVAAVERVRAEGITFAQLAAAFPAKIGLTNMYHEVVLLNREAMLRYLIATPSARFAQDGRYLLGAAIRHGHRNLVELLLPLATTNVSLDEAAQRCVETGDALGYLVPLVNAAKNHTGPEAKDQQGLSHREYLATQMLIQAIWLRQPILVQRLLTHTEAQPDYDQGKPLREAIIFKGNEEAVRLLVPITSLENVRAWCAKNRAWTTLDQLSAFVPADIEAAWLKRHRNLTEAHARRRVQEAQQRSETALESTPAPLHRSRHRPRT